VRQFGAIELVQDFADSIGEIETAAMAPISVASPMWRI
jgi:hypothetical protein